MRGRKDLETRVSAGALKGRLLVYPRDRAIRPTMQRTKTSVFESIRGSLQDCVFVDLFAGAGGMGIEALSRGARVAHFVEFDALAARYLETNLSRCGLPAARAVVHRVPVMQFLERGGLEAIRPDIVYADPPYEQDAARLLLEFFNSIEYPLETLLILEHRADLVSVAEFGRLALLKARRLGQSCVSYVVKKGDGS
jgi:16S rRNA (guanine966-N2)-methyltransferase